MDDLFGCGDAPQLAHLDCHGYVMLTGVFRPEAMTELALRLSRVLATRQEPSVLRSRGQVYGSRNLLETVPAVAPLVTPPVLRDLLRSVLGPEAGLVRVLFFDKPPDRSWSLPWHRDRTIAVQRNDLPSPCFSKPTSKAGVPHVEAPVSILEAMLTLRVHVDPMTADNGPLHVLPGSHRILSDPADGEPRELHCAAGDVLAMRPLLSHSSTMSRPGNVLHRRIIHLEFAGCPALSDGYAWHTFRPLKDIPLAKG